MLHAFAARRVSERGCPLLAASDLQIIDVPDDPPGDRLSVHSEFIWNRNRNRNQNLCGFEIRRRGSVP